MARYTVRTGSSIYLNFTNSSDITKLRDAQRSIYLQVYYGNRDAEVIRTLNLIPTIASQFKGLVGGVAEFASLLGDFAETAAADYKKSVLDGINSGYYFFNSLKWDPNYISVKVTAPCNNMYDNNTGKYIRYINGTPFVTSKTRSDGVTITF